MKKYIILLLILFSIQITTSQVIYENQFTSPPAVSLENSNVAGYTFSTNEGVFTITGDGGAGQYTNIEYELANAIDVSTSPKLYVKIKASDNITFRVDMVDEDGFLTNNIDTTTPVTLDYGVYELDFTDKFTDGGYTEPCLAGGTSGANKCPVDRTKIKRFFFLVDGPGGTTYSGFDGTVDIEWISIGTFLEEPFTPPTTFPPAPPAFNIRYNQLGYAKGRDKFISLVDNVAFTGTDFEVKNSSGTVVLSDTSADSQLWEDSNEEVATVDISAIDEAGEYTFTANEQSITFKVSDAPYEAIRKAAFKYYYYNRASSAVTPEFGGEYSWASGIPDNEVVIHRSAALPGVPGYEEDDTISSPGGWYDAGDYGKYVVNSGISTYTLLAAYEHYPEFYNLQNFNIPESNNNLPDILDEAKYNLDWMLTMQDPQGGVFHKLTAKGFSGRSTMPADYGQNPEPDLKRYVIKQTTAATLNFAAVMATASRIFATISGQEEYAEGLIQASKKAYAWTQIPGNENIIYRQFNDNRGDDDPTNDIQQDPLLTDITTGPYQDYTLSDEYQWAAAELFITTGDAKYSGDLKLNEIGGGSPAWPYVDPLALISLTFHQNKLSGFDVATAKTTLIETGDELANKINTSSVMRVGMSINDDPNKNGDYVWGSNGNAANQLMMLIRTYEATDDTKYLNAAFTGLDYLLGRNGTGYCAVTGFGDRRVMEPHHRLSEGDGVPAPIPGMLAGGPQKQLNPGGEGCNEYPSSFAAAKYLDNWCSFSTNEVTINWNAPLVYVLNALHFYQNGLDLLSVTTNKIDAAGISLYPNPSDGILKISLPENDPNNYMIAIYSIQGKKVLETAAPTNGELNIQTFPSGLYIVKFTNQNNKSFIAKIVR